MRGVVDALQGRELGALVQVLAGVHVGEAHARAERRADRLAGDDRLGARDLRQRDVALRARAIHLDLGYGAVLARALHALERRLRERGLRLLRLQLGLLDGDVQPNEHRARVDDLPGREHDPADGAGELVAQGDRAQRDDRPDRRRRLALLEGLRDGDRYRHSRLGLVRRSGAGFPHGRVLPRGEGPCGSDNRGEQQHGSDPAATTHAWCPPAGLAAGTVASGNGRAGWSRSMVFAPRPSDGPTVRADSTVRTVCQRPVLRSVEEDGSS